MTLIQRVTQYKNQILLISRRFYQKAQEEVLNLIRIGKSNQSIATELGLTIPTIKMHVSAIFKKLDAKNRTEAVAKYSDIQKVSDLIT